MPVNNAPAYAIFDKDGQFSTFTSEPDPTYAAPEYSVFELTPQQQQFIAMRAARNEPPLVASLYNGSCLLHP